MTFLLLFVSLFKCLKLNAVTKMGNIYSETSFISVSLYLCMKHIARGQTIAIVTRP